jgi:hypothetical protein
MKTRLLFSVVAMSTMVAGFQETAVSQTARGTKSQSADIQQLNEGKIAAADWKKVGFASPQDTAQTFMWAMRERDFDTIKQCFHNPEKMDDPCSDKESIDRAGAAAKGHKVLALKRVDQATVELKFIVEGWGETPMVHRLKKTEAGWKLDGDSSTYDADW